MSKRKPTFLAIRFTLAFMIMSGLVGVGFVRTASAAPGDMTRISVDGSGLQANGESDWPTMSADGRYVAFYSYATNLVANDVNGVSDVFVRDAQTGVVSLVSVSSTGVQANADSHDAVISANGRYVSFLSKATNLVPQSDMANTYDVFVRDLHTNTTTAVSVTLSSTLSTSNSYHQFISDDGRYVSFNSSESGFVAGDTNSISDIFLRDMQTGTTTRVSVSSSNAQANNTSFYPSMSGEGRYIAFHSSATNLVANDTNGNVDIFVRDTVAGITTRVSMNSAGSPSAGGDSFYPAISSTGRYVAFQSAASNLVVNDTNNKADIFLRDTQTGTTALVSVASNGGFPNDDSQKASVSEDGRYVVFDSKATNLAAGDTNLVEDVFLRDMLADTTTWVSLNSNNAVGTGRDGDIDGSSYAHITPNGQYIAFKSFATNLVAGADTNSTADVFVYEQALLPAPPTKTPTVTQPPTATLSVSGFPSTSLLDDFNRSNGVIGSNWSDETSGYAIAANRLDVTSNDEVDIYWSPAIFGIDQEAYVTLSNIDPAAPSTAEIALLLKSQNKASPISAKLAIVYNSSNDTVLVWTYTQTANPQWVAHGSALPVTFSNGDKFGARARANGLVEVYKNSTLVGSQSITSWPYYPLGGYIGLVHFNAGNTLLDDFSGGTMPGSATLTPTPAACTDPTSCSSNVNAITSVWKCTPSGSLQCQGSQGADWLGAVVSWPSWSAYQTNARTGSNSRTVVSSPGNQPLYPYMGTWADGCQVTALTNGVLIIEWQRGTDLWDEIRLNQGQSYTIDIISPQDNAMIEGDNGVTSFSVSLTNCNPQPLSGPTFTPTATSTPSNTLTATFTPSNTPTATFTPSNTPTATFTPSNTPTATFTPSNTPTVTFTPSRTPTATFTPSNTPTATFTPSRTPTATFTPSNTPTATFTPSRTPTATFTPSNTATASFTPSSTPTNTATVTAAPTKTKKPNQSPTKPPRKSVAVLPINLTTQSGSVNGSLSSLGEIEQNGVEDNPSAYVRFQTPGNTYMGYKSFVLPADAPSNSISTMLLQVNFKGVTSAQVWTWSMFDWTTGNWVIVGNNLGTQSNQWNTMIFPVYSITRYISPLGQVRVRLQSNDPSEDAKVDYSALHITYDPVEPTPTPVIPTALPTKPNYNFPATYTPTATP